MIEANDIAKPALFDVQDSLFYIQQTGNPAQRSCARRTLASLRMNRITEAQAKNNLRLIHERADS